jgi:hypothetical protein
MEENTGELFSSEMADNPKHKKQQKKTYGEQLINSQAGCSLLFGISAIILLFIFLFAPKQGIPVVTLFAFYGCIIYSISGFILSIISLIANVWNSRLVINCIVSLMGLISCAFALLYLLANS